MTYPYKPLVVPTALKNVENGKLNPSILKKARNGGEFWHNAAVAFDQMFLAAEKAGIRLKNIGDYRPYESQLSMFLDRYDKVDHGRGVTRTWNGVKYFLKPGKAPSATPGTSNHGLGLAIDLDVTDRKVLDWLCANAPKYGFYLQGSNPSSPEFEAWHWQYCEGNGYTPLVQKAVDDFLKIMANAAKQAEEPKAEKKPAEKKPAKKK